MTAPRCLRCCLPLSSVEKEQEEARAALAARADEVRAAVSEERLLREVPTALRRGLCTRAADPVLRVTAAGQAAAHRRGALKVPPSGRFAGATLWGWLVSLPHTLAAGVPVAARPSGVPLLAKFGALMFAAGFAVETVADLQKWAFKNDAANALGGLELFEVPLGE